VLSPLWLKYYRFGPLEWCWRALTYWQRPAMRLTPRAVTMPASPMPQMP
jgi:uncharacterized protein